ncbi:MAG: M48 family metalloprotease [Clostridia bacterium]|nr:M48 family metalloprotease [Clostridia bacterium]
MYLLDFLKNITKKSNIGVLIWIILNAALLTFIGGMYAEYSGSVDLWVGCLAGFALYLLSVVIALSPVGEYLLRLQQHCKKIKDPALLNRLEPLFNEVYSRAKEATPSLNDNIQFFLSDDESPNAFATGRQTVCITKGFLAFSDEEIKGALAHEFGHLAHKDTDIILFVATGNLIVTGLFWIWQRVVDFFSFITAIIAGIFTKRGWGAILTAFIKRIFIDTVLSACIWLWTKIGVLICMASSRENEFLADEYAYNLGFGNQLANVLGKLGGSDSKGLWAALNSSHPKTSLRIEKLQSYSQY